MGLFDAVGKAIKSQLIDVIEWTDNSQNTMVWKFQNPNNKDEIKNGAQLIVRESQNAVFLLEGEFGDVYGPGRHELVTRNMPIITSLKSWKYGFDSPFKCDVYFVNTKQFLDQKWGTSNPIMMRDAEFGAIRLRGFGNYAFRVTDPVKFLKDVFGTNANFKTEDLTGHIKRLILSGLTDYIAESKIPALDLAMNYDELGEGTLKKLRSKFSDMGIDITQFCIENLSLPEEVEKMLDKKTQMGIIGNTQQYAQFQMADSIKDFANKPSGMGGGFADAGMGMAMGQMMGNMMGGMMNNGMNGGYQQQPQYNQGGAMPPPMPGAVKFHAVINGAQAGPFEIGALQQMIASGQFTKQTIVWKDGMANWAAAGTVPELSQLFGAVPPPPPVPPVPPQM